MKTFRLPDLGEGLPDAEIREWYVKVGDEVNVDQPMVAMETAKALVDVPAPFAGKIEKLFGEVGTVIETGQPLVGFAGEAEDEPEKKDSGTVVGAIQTGERILQESATGIVVDAGARRARATPQVRAFARQMGVDINRITPRGDRLTIEDIKANIGNAPIPEGMQQLSAARRAMVLSMNQSREEIVPVTIVDDADIHAWQGKQDITLRIIRAIAHAVTIEPMLNVHYDSKSMSYRKNEHINLGLAVDMPHGLYVPVLRDIGKQSDEHLRAEINRFKEEAQNKAIRAEDLKGATLMLSNFGSLAGRYANPIIIPPMVAIIGIGKKRNEVVSFNDNIETHPILPISVTTDHRAVTGGEAARFLKAMMDDLAEPN